MGYFDNVQRDYSNLNKDYTPSMDASRFASAGPSPITNNGFRVADGQFGVQQGTFKPAAGTFMPSGSDQQIDAIKSATRLGMPSALNPNAPPVKSPLAPLGLGQPQAMLDKKTGQLTGWLGADVRLSPYLQDGFSSSRPRSGLGLSSDDDQGDNSGF
jgi:hypothetical protein